MITVIVIVIIYEAQPSLAQNHKYEAPNDKTYQQ